MHVIEQQVERYNSEFEFIFKVEFGLIKFNPNLLLNHLQNLNN
jgi:hypothetical protein